MLIICINPLLMLTVDCWNTGPVSGAHINYVGIYGVLVHPLRVKGFNNPRRFLTYCSVIIEFLPFNFSEGDLISQRHLSGAFEQRGLCICTSSNLALIHDLLHKELKTHCQPKLFPLPTCATQVERSEVYSCLLWNMHIYSPDMQPLFTFSYIGEQYNNTSEPKGLLTSLPCSFLLASFTFTKIFHQNLVGEHTKRTGSCFPEMPSPPPNICTWAIRTHVQECWS